MQNFENLTEKQVESREIFDGYIMHVFKDTVELPNGKLAPREYMRHVGAVCVIPVLEDGSVLIERQYRYPVGEVLTEIPAGKLDHPGEDRAEAARRELREETGLSAGKWTHLTDIVTTPGFCDEMISIYLAEELTRGETDPDEDEFLNIVKMPLSELTERVMRGEIADSKTIIGALMAEKRLKEDGHGV